MKEGNVTKRIILYPHSAQRLWGALNQFQLTYDVVSTYVGRDKYLTVKAICTPLVLLLLIYLYRQPQLYGCRSGTKMIIDIPVKKIYILCKHFGHDVGLMYR